MIDCRVSPRPSLDMYLQYLTRLCGSISQDNPLPLFAFLTGIVTVLFIIWNKRSGQRLVPGVPIVGGKDTATIKQNRIRFVHDGKRMLQEGYQAVCYTIIYASSSLNFVLTFPSDRWRIVLRSKQAWRTADAPHQVSGTAEVCSYPRG